MRTPSQAQLLAELLYARFETPVVITAGPGSSILAYSEQPASRIDALRREAVLLNNPAHLPQAAAPSRDPKVGLTRSPANEELQALPRTIITIPHRGFAVGYVFAVDPDQRIPADWHLQNERTLTAVGLEIELIRSRSLQVQHAVQSALSPEQATHRLGVESLLAMRTFQDTTRVRALVCELTDDSTDIERLLWEGSPGGDAAWAQVDDRLVMVVDEDKSTPMKEIGRFAAILQRSNPVPTAVYGIGGAVGGLDAVRQTYDEALGALRVARTVRDRSPIAHWERLGSWRTLASLGREDGLRSMDPRVARLVADERAENIEVLREYLERNGEVEQLASELHLHRSTIYNRLRRLEEKYVLDLNDVEDRLATVIGLRLAQLYT